MSRPGGLVLSARTAEYSTTPNPLGRPGGPGLFHVKGLMLPAYVQNVAKAIMRSGRTKSQAIRIALGRIEDWKNGKGSVSPEVRAAAAKAWAQWLAARAKAKAIPNRVAASNQKGALMLANMTSQDGPRVTRQVGTRPSTGTARPPRRTVPTKPVAATQKKPGQPPKLSAAQIKMLVDRYDTVPVPKRDAYRARVIALARAAGALSTIPQAWLKGHPGVPAGAGGKSTTSLANAITEGVTRALRDNGIRLATPLVLSLAGDFTPSGAPTAGKRQRAQRQGNTFGQSTTAPVENLADLDKAIQAYGHIPPSNRVAYVKYLRMQARKLGAPPATVDRINNLGVGS